MSPADKPATHSRVRCPPLRPSAGPDLAPAPSRPPAIRSSSNCRRRVLYEPPCFDHVATLGAHPYHLRPGSHRHSGGSTCPGRQSEAICLHAAGDPLQGRVLVVKGLFGLLILT